MRGPTISPPRYANAFSTELCINANIRPATGRVVLRKTGLEIEHERPFALFHSHEERFLKALCRRLNLFQAERVYGPEFIRAKINAKKGREGSQAFSQPFAPGTI